MLSEIVQNLGHPRVLVLGDVMLDRYTVCNAKRISPEAPVIVCDRQASDVRLGGAGSVATMLRRLGAVVSLATVVGDDFAGRTVKRLMDEQGMDSLSVIVDAARRTSTKERIVGQVESRHSHHILRIDDEDTSELEPGTIQELRSRLEDEIRHCDAVLLSDYAKGVCESSLVKTAIALASKRNIPIVADPARRSSFAVYQGATAVTPNREEAALAAGRTSLDVSEAPSVGRQLCQEFHIGSAVITLDKDGIVVASDRQDATFHAARPSRTVYDVTGAGDMVLAIIGICLASGIELTNAAELANVAAGLVIQELGVAAVTQSELLAAIRTTGTISNTGERPVDLATLRAVAAEHRRNGRRLVLTNGCFDLLHMGHVKYLDEARRLGDVLIVAINDDESVRRLKGRGRPVVGERGRAAVVAALRSVDHVIVFSGRTPEEVITAVHPDVLVKGGDYQVGEIVGQEIVQSYGGQVHSTGMYGDVSSSLLIDRVRSNRCRTSCCGHQKALARNALASEAGESGHGCLGDRQ